MTTMSVVGECSFWFQLTRVVPDNFHRAVKRLCCVCVCVVWDCPGEPVPEETFTHWQLSFINFLHLLWSIASFLFNLRAWHLFAQPLSKSCLVYLLVWYLPFHTPYISSPNHCLATHVHTEIMSPNPSLSLSSLLGTQFNTIHQHLHPHSKCHLNSKTYPLTPDLH